MKAAQSLRCFLSSLTAESPTCWATSAVLPSATGLASGVMDAGGPAGVSSLWLALLGGVLTDGEGSAAAVASCPAKTCLRISLTVLASCASSGGCSVSPLSFRPIATIFGGRSRDWDGQGPHQGGKPVANIWIGQDGCPIPMFARSVDEDRPTKIDR